MKATGIVRRIDDLGRVVIPKEIRRTMRIREGDPLEIYTDKDGGVIFKKYSLMGGLGDFVYQGTSSNNNTLILLGAIPAAILAILFGAVIDLLQKKVTPRGLRKGAGK